MAKYILISLFIVCSVSFGKVLTQDTGKIHITNIETNAFRALPQHTRHIYDDVALENRRANHREPSEKDKLYFIEPGAVTNSHKPQYYEETKAEAAPEKAGSENKNLVRKIVITQTQTPQIIKKEDTPEINNETVMEEAPVDDLNIDEEEYKPSNHLRNKQNQIKAILVKILEKSDQKRKFAEVLPILKVMTPVQRLTMASLVSKQLTSDSRNPPLNLAQVKAMFGNNPNVTAELMLPIMLDIANMFRAAKDQQKLHTEKAPQAQLLRRSFSGDEDMDPVIEQSFKALVQLGERVDERITTQKPMKIAAKLSSILKNTSIDLDKHNNAEEKENNTISDDDYDTISSTDTPETFVYAAEIINGTLVIHDNSSLLGNNTGYLSEDLPTAEKLRALNRYIDRNGNLVVLARPPWIHGVSGNTMSRRKVGEQTTDRLSQRRKIPPVSRQTLLEMAKQKCELFTTSLCLDSLDYPVEAISNSIRRNQAAMGALLADFPEVSADSAIDGVSSKQENMYTPEHYMNSLNRREDGVTSPVGAAGFMCPSTVKYARPQKARATSGQWKYIVNTGEHTQTLRLEKCLRPREPCTYLTDNFKSKCVQVYNYHRLLTWDQHNGLHMDIFKVPTCCSCHIEGYSVSFPPHVHRPAESTSEQFPGEDLSHDQDANPYENVQPSIRHSIRTSTFSIPPPVDSFPALGDNQNFISGSSFVRPLYKDDDPGLHDLKHLPVSNQFDSINSNFHTDIFQQQGTNIRSIKKPNPIRGATGGSGLPSFLEPPSKPPGPVLNTFLKSPDVPTKYKPFINSHFKRGASGTQIPNKRPNRRPIRKKTSNVSGDQLVGASNVHENPTIINMESFEDINDSMEFYENSSPKMPPGLTTRSSTPKTRQLSTSKFTIKNVSPTTERYYPKSTPVDHGSAILKDIALNRRVNYNYHPIIDFFEGGSKKETDVASDRIDSESLFLEGQDSDWRPMPGHVALPLKSGPPSTASPNKNM